MDYSEVHACARTGADVQAKLMRIAAEYGAIPVSIVPARPVCNTCRIEVTAIAGTYLDEGVLADVMAVLQASQEGEANLIVHFK